MLTLEYKSGKISAYSMENPGKCAERIKGVEVFLMHDDVVVLVVVVVMVVVEGMVQW